MPQLPAFLQKILYGRESLSRGQRGLATDVLASLAHNILAGQPYTHIPRTREFLYVQGGEVFIAAADGSIINPQEQTTIDLRDSAQMQVDTLRRYLVETRQTLPQLLSSNQDNID